MGTSMLDALAGVGLLALLASIAGAILVGALLLCLAFGMVLGYLPSYPRAVGAVLLTVAASLLVSGALRMVMPMKLSSLVAVVVQFLIGAAVVKRLLLAQDGSQIAYAKACMVQLVNLLFFVAVGVVVVAAVMFGTPFAHIY